MFTFTIICGIATLVSLILQLTSLPAKYKKYFNQAMIFFLGATLGLLFNFASTVNVTLPETLTVAQLKSLFIVCGTGLLIAILILMSVLLENEKQRSDAARGASAASGFFILYLMFGAT